MNLSDADRAAEADYARHCDHLVEVAGRVVPLWIVRCVETRHPGELPVAVRREAEAAALAAGDDVTRELSEMFARGVDAEGSTPLTILRRVSRHATAVLDRAGVAPVQRDAFDAARLPDDPYALAPAKYADVGEELAEPGMVWGAAKAHLHLRRRSGRGSG